MKVFISRVLFVSALVWLAGTKSNNAFEESSENELLYPVGESLEINSAKALHDEPLKFRIPVFGFGFHYIWVHKDGYVTFNKGMKSYNFPLSFPMEPENPDTEEDPSLIAIFFAQQDVPREIVGAGVFMKKIDFSDTEDLTLKERLLSDLDSAMPGSVGFHPSHVLIITWRNMTFANRKVDRPIKTNTYQMVIATNEMQTFIIFNYEQITWTTHFDQFDGINGPAAYVGFNAGNLTRSFEFVPFSQNPRLTLLTTMGFGNGLLGRYYFSVEEEIHPGACVHKDLDPQLTDRQDLTTSINWVYMLGGELINVTGPCIEPDSEIVCNFDSSKVEGIYLNYNKIGCIVPPMIYEGYIDLTVTVDGRTSFYARMYVQSPEVKKYFDVTLVENEIYENMELNKTKHKHLTINWRHEALSDDPKAMVSISVYGYRESGEDTYPSLTFLATLADGIENDGTHQIDLETIPQVLFLKKVDYTFGFIAVNLSGAAYSSKIWTKPIPLAWFMHPVWELRYGRRWNERFCSDWVDTEETSYFFATTVNRCPCNGYQAEIDRGRFAPHLLCNLIDKKCEPMHHGAHFCVRSSRPSIGGSGQTCCYDDHMELMQTADTIYGGRPSRSFIYGRHPFKMRFMVPSLSYWYHDVMPFFYCCKWAKGVNSESCQRFNYWRTSQDCSSYKPPGIGSIFGDPHVITFDNFNYTFNGKGEFVLVRVDDNVRKLHIHGRFDQLNNVHGTHLTGVAVRDNVSAIVEFRVRPVAARWQYQMYLIADKEFYYFWNENMRFLNLPGVSLYQPADIRNMSHIIAMFDSGVGVEVIVSPIGSLTLNVYLPDSFLNRTAGLLGKWSKNENDDLMLPNKRVVPLSVAQSMERLHNEFGVHWRLTEIEKLNVGRSLFWHNVLSHSSIDDRHFRPQFDVQVNEKFDEIASTVCSSSKACLYDLMVTNDPLYAKETRESEALVHSLRNSANESIIRCPALPTPQFGRKSENRYWPGVIVRFVCNDGYRLFGHEIRRCREDGMWSWGEDPQCVSESTYILVISSILLIIVALVAIAIVVFCCVCRYCSKKDNSETEKRGISLLSSFTRNNRSPTIT